MIFAIVDNFIPLVIQEDIKNKLLREDFDWHYLPDITYGVDVKEQKPAFRHIFKNDDKIIKLLATKGAEEVNYATNKVNQARSFLQLPLSKEFISSSTDLLHVDIHRPHLVVLYYVMDSDGDTIIVDKQANESEPIRYDLRAEDFDSRVKVKPKQGRAVIFDGSYYHTAEQPTNSVRCIINVDIAE